MTFLILYCTFCSMNIVTFEEWGCSYITILLEKCGPEPQAQSLTFRICYIVQMCQQLIIVVSTGNSLIRSPFDLIFIFLTSFCSYMPNYHISFSLIGLHPIIYYSFAYTSFHHFTSFMTLSFQQKLGLQASVGDA